MAKCQTHASWNKIHAFLLLIPFPAVSASPSHSTRSSDGKETQPVVGEELCIVVLFLGIYFIHNQNKYVHSFSHTVKSQVKDTLQVSLPF